MTQVSLAHSPVLSSIHRLLSPHTDASTTSAPLGRRLRLERAQRQARIREKLQEGKAPCRLAHSLTPAASRPPLICFSLRFHAGPCQERAHGHLPLSPRGHSIRWLTPLLQNLTRLLTQERKQGIHPMAGKGEVRFSGVGEDRADVRACRGNKRASPQGPCPGVCVAGGDSPRQR